MQATVQPARRDPSWALIALIAGGMLVIAAAIWAFVLFLLGVLRGTEPYRHGLAAAQSDRRVEAALGRPIEASPLFEGNFSVSDRSGQAYFSVPIHGSRAAGTLHIVAHRDGGPWRYPTLSVSLADGRRLDLERAQP